PEATKATNRPAGQKLASHRPTTRERSTGTIVDSGLGLNYTELAWLLASVIARPQLAQIASGVHQRTFRLNRRTCDDFQTYSAAIGDDCLAPGGDWVTAAYAMINSLGLTFGRNETSISGSVVANRMLQDQARPAGTNEVQTLTLGAVVTGGTLTLLFNGQQIGPIAGSANMQTAMQTAFNTALGAGNMTVGGSGTNYTLTGAGALAGRNLPMVEVAPGGNALTAATTVSIVETTRGGFIEPVIEPVLPGHWEVWMADTLGGLGQEPNRLTSLFQAELSIERGRNPVNRAGRALGTGFARVAEAEDTINLTLSGESAGNLKAARNRSLADAVTYIRLEAVGPVIGATGINHSLQFDLCCKVDEEQGFGDADGVRDVTYRFVPVFDDAWGNALVARLVNGLSGAQL
ncbi:MAG: hypothetical protein MH204_02960, partial [Fimbriimonadaceae bacterium]|nr:hypothetical protein [Fimbriimonadaceae bacterium]